MRGRSSVCGGLGAPFSCTLPAILATPRPTLMLRLIKTKGHRMVPFETRTPLKLGLGHAHEGIPGVHTVVVGAMRMFWTTGWWVAARLTDSQPISIRRQLIKIRSREPPL